MNTKLERSNHSRADSPEKGSSDYRKVAQRTAAKSHHSVAKEHVAVVGVDSASDFSVYISSRVKPCMESVDERLSAPETPFPVTKNFADNGAKKAQQI